MYCLNNDYCTTSYLVCEIPLLEKTSADKFAPMLFLPPCNDRFGEGGLRTKGYFSKNLPDKPLITVITVVFNGEQYIENCILNVIRNSYKNIEYIVIDGGSQDGTVSFLLKYNDEISYWVSEKDKGVYDAMNKAVRVATGKFIYFLGVDDQLVPAALSKVCDVITSTNFTNAVFYGDVYMPGKHKIYDGKFSRFKLLRRNICHQAIFYPREVFFNERFDLQYPVLADHDLNIRIAATWRLCYMPILVAYYNDSGFSSKNVDHNFSKNYFHIIKTNWGSFFFVIFWCWSLLSNIVRNLIILFRQLHNNIAVGVQRNDKFKR